MKYTTWISKRALMATVVVSIGFLQACTGKSWFSYTGWEAKPENRYVLEKGGPHAVIWKSRDLEIHYRYYYNDNRLDMDGRVVKRDGIQHFNELQAWVSIHILDANGIILDTHRLWSQNGSNVYGTVRSDFHQSWELPPDNKAVGFSFSGVAGGGEDGSWNFWQTP